MPLYTDALTQDGILLVHPHNVHQDSIADRIKIWHLYNYYVGVYTVPFFAEITTCMNSITSLNPRRT